MFRFRATYAEIRLSHLIHNYRFLQSSLDSSVFFCPMIKANAYGHGDRECARAFVAAGAKHLGVVMVEEAIELRKSGIDVNILVFGTFHKEAVAEIIKYNLTPVVSRWTDIQNFEEQISAGTTFGIHLKFNTGMNRMGFDVEDAGILAQTLEKSQRLRLEGICTHFSNGEDSLLTDGISHEQIIRLEEVTTHFNNKNLIIHALNSSAICLKAFSGLGARPGIALYGCRPSLQSDAVLDLRPVMTVKSRIEHLQKVSRGSRVSYGGTWTATRDSVIGIVPVGYADGYPRLASNKASMLVRGMRVPVAGIVCMDYTMLDLTEIKKSQSISVGEEVVILGQQGSANVSAEELAETCNTISYEILTGISSRVPRVYLHEGL